MSLFPFSKPPPGAQIDWTHPLSRGLVGCWLFNEGAGIRANDLSPYGNHGTLTNFGAGSATSGWTGGKFGTALQCDGVDDAINCGDSISLRCTGKNLTIEMLLYPRSITTNQRLVDKLVIGYGYMLEIRSDNTLRLSITASLAGFMASSNANALALNAWNHVIVSYDIVNVYFFINGNDWGSPALAQIIKAGTTPFGIGARYDGSTGASNVIIGLVRIWDRNALSSQEAQYLYTNPFCMFRSRPIGVRQY